MRSVKRVICKIWTELSTGTMANSTDPDKNPQSPVSDKGLHSLHKLQEVKG